MIATIGWMLETFDCRLSPGCIVRGLELSLLGLHAGVPIDADDCSFIVLNHKLEARLHCPPLNGGLVLRSCNLHPSLLVAVRLVDMERHYTTGSDGTGLVLRELFPSPVMIDQYAAARTRLVATRTCEYVFRDGLRMNCNLIVERILPPGSTGTPS